VTTDHIAHANGKREVANNKKRAPSLIPHNFAKVATDDINIVTNLPTDPSLRRHRNQTMNTTSPPSPSIAMMPIKLEDAVAVANNDSTPFPTSSSATVPIKLEDAEVNNGGTPSPLSSIATMPIKLEDAVAEAINDGTTSPPSSSIANFPIKLEDAEANNNDGTPSPPSSIATIKQEDDVANIDDGARFDDEKMPEAEPAIDDDTIIAATTPSPASSASEKRSVQDTSEATSKPAKLVENSNAAAKGFEPVGNFEAIFEMMICTISLMEMGIDFSDRESIVKACITAIKELNLAAMNILIPLMDMGYFATIHKIDSDLLTEVNVLEEQVEELQDELRRSDDLMERNENAILKELIRVGNCRLDIAHSRMALCHILYQIELAPEE
jgi:hypothetical protein